jgi:hypothetical protein
MVIRFGRFARMLQSIKEGKLECFLPATDIFVVRKDQR